MIIKDIGLAAYLKVVKNINFITLPRKDERVFIFDLDISEEDLASYRIEYLNSDFRLFDQEIRDLKKCLNT